MFYTVKENDVDQFADYQFKPDCKYTDICTASEWMEERDSKYLYQDGEIILNPNYEEEQIQARKQQFIKDFFQTSLGYVRRKVSMATGETKDFLSDLLPTISMGVQMGQPVSIITYKEPDFTTDEIDWVALQEVKTVTAQFVQECFMQLSNDFKPVEPPVNNSEPDVDNSKPTDEENSVVEEVTGYEAVDNTENEVNNDSTTNNEQS